MSRRPVPPSEENEPKTGSPATSGPGFLIVGRLMRPHGVTGELRMEVLTDFPERLRAGQTVYLGPEHQPFTMTGVRSSDKALLIRLEGILDRDQAALLRGNEVSIQGNSLPELPDGEYYYHQLIGLQVIDESGAVLGVLEQILETGANDVYVVKPEDGPEVLLPAIESVILSVDLQNRRMTVRPQTWD
ncbi:MAG TPA: ribosome maturation factor RimM [Anaerolineaceae bacterium]|jgi:16S rRNA processing protein RimM